MIGSIILDVLKNSIFITGLVVVLMILIEYVNIQSQGKLLAGLSRRPILQVFVGALFGLVPGCVGGFVAVSLYTHGLLSFGALVAMMIAASGDEAFVMLSVIPETALYLFPLIYLIAILTGIAVHFIFRKKNLETHHCDISFNVHKNEILRPWYRLSSYADIKKFSRPRVATLLLLLLFSLAVFTGVFDHDHAHGDGHDHEHVHSVEHVQTDKVADGETCLTDTEGVNLSCAAPDCIEYSDECELCEKALSMDKISAPEASHSKLSLFTEKWLLMIFAVLSLIAFCLTLTATEHFVREHLWNHIIKKHLLSVFLWTAGALLFVQIGMHFFDFEHILKDNMYAVLVIAVLIGIIPESGPHLVFITLFAGGYIPFGILLANSIVQDGHTALPLLANNKKDFLLAKLINVVVGFVVGLLFLLLWNN